MKEGVNYMFTNQLSDNWARKKRRYQIARHSLATDAGLIPKIMK